MTSLILYKTSLSLDTNTEITDFESSHSYSLPNPFHLLYILLLFHRTVYNLCSWWSVINLPSTVYIYAINLHVPDQFRWYNKQATGWIDWSLNPSGKRLFPLQTCSDQLWGLTSLQIQWVLEFFPKSNPAEERAVEEWHLPFTFI